MAKYDLTCCNHVQRNILIAIACYAAFILAAWRIDFVMKPFKLLAVFVHEANHALACILTGGHVDGLEVNLNEGGVTKYRGGWQRVITPAGYLGGAFWGAAATAVLGWQWGRYVVLGLLAGSLFLTLICLAIWSKAENRALTGAVCVFFIGICILLAWADNSKGGDQDVVALYALLFISTFVSAFSVYDIYDDCIARYVSGEETSDAVVCARNCPICPARGWGVVWFVIGLGMWVGGIIALLVIVGEEGIH